MKVCKLQNRWSFTGSRYGALCVYPSLAKTQHLSAMFPYKFPYNNLTSSVGPGHTNPFGPPSNTHALSISLILAVILKMTPLDC